VRVVLRSLHESNIKFAVGHLWDRICSSPNRRHSTHKQKELELGDGAKLPVLIVFLTQSTSSETSSAARRSSGEAG
jgi:hypothetical protein